MWIGCGCISNIVLSRYRKSCSVNMAEGHCEVESVFCVCAQNDTEFPESFKIEDQWSDRDDG